MGNAVCPCRSRSCCRIPGLTCWPRVQFGKPIEGRGTRTSYGGVVRDRPLTARVRRLTIRRFRTRGHEPSRRSVATWGRCMEISEQELEDLRKLKAGLVWQRRLRWIPIPLAFAWMTLSAFAGWPALEIPGWTVLIGIWPLLWRPMVPAWVLEALERYVAIEPEARQPGPT